MTQPEYEQKKECWEALHNELLKGEVQWQPVSRKEIFSYVFDRAYTLGKQAEAITQEDVEKAADEFADKEYMTNQYERDALYKGYYHGMKDALGKQEKEAESISLWERLTDDEKREMQCRYHTNECVLRDHKMRTGDKAQSKAVARMKLLENLFGKDNLKVEKK